MHILAPHISCVVGPDEFATAVAEGYKEIYIITSKGVIKHHQLRGENRFVRLKVDTIPGYTETKIDEAVNFLPAGKIPHALYLQVLAFFQKVMEVQQSEVEAMIHILYNPEQGYHLGVPPQRVSKAAVSYDWSYIPSGTSIIVDIHSHNTMGAFFSGTDNNDDRKNVSFSGVFGKLKNPTPETVWRFNYFDKKFDAKIEHIFEAPPVAEVEVPQDWLDQIQVQTYSYQGGTRGQGNVVNYPVSHASRPHNSTGKAMWDHQYSPPNANSNVNGNGQKVLALQSQINQRLGIPDQSNHHLADAGVEGAFFGFDTEDYVMNEAYRGAGLEPLTNAELDRQQREFDEKWAWDPKAARYVLRETDGDVDANRGDFNLASVTEDALGQEESHLGKSQGAVSTQVPRSLAPGFNDHRYEEIVAQHGVDVADAWYAIDTEMSQLDGKDEINAELIMDMFNLTSEAGQLDVFKQILDNLPERVKEQLMTHGL